MIEKVTRHECEQALKDFTGAVMRSPATMKFDNSSGKQILKSRYQRQHDLLKQLIDEHFALLKFEEMNKYQEVLNWSNKEEEND